MPRKGYKCLTVTDKVHQDISQRAKECNCTIMDYVERLLSSEKNKVKETKTNADSNSAAKRKSS